MKKEEKKLLFWGSIVAIVFATMFLIIFSIFGGWSLAGQQRFEVVAVVLIAIAIASFAITISIIATDTVKIGSIPANTFGLNALMMIIIAVASVVALTLTGIKSFFFVATIIILIVVLLINSETNRFTVFSLLGEFLIVFAAVSAVLFLF